MHEHQPNRPMLELPAPAKINLHLLITGRDARGYHLLDTSFAYVDAGDVLHIETADDIRVTCSDPRLNGEDNLVYRVLHALRERFDPRPGPDIRHGLHVHVDKHLPSQAGLGGGSSDAATALLAANHLWRLNLDSAGLIEFAAPYGADIPCFLFGRASLAAGIGEQLRPLPLPGNLPPVVLAHPGVGLSTAGVFAHFDAAHNLQAGQLTPQGAGATMRAGLKAAPGKLADLSVPLGENDLEEISGRMCPELARLLQGMSKMNGASWMSGSGTACVALCDDEAQAGMLARQLAEQHLATWTHAGKLLADHPLLGSHLQPDDWGVAKW